MREIAVIILVTFLLALGCVIYTEHKVEPVPLVRTSGAQGRPPIVTLPPGVNPCDYVDCNRPDTKRIA